MDDRRYKIMNESTTGWVLIDNKAPNLTKQECDKWINDLIIGVAEPRYLGEAAKDKPP